MYLIEIVIFAVLAAVVGYQFWGVLGRKIGRQPEDAAQGPAPARPEVAAPSAPSSLDAPALDGLSRLRARDPAFDPAHFLTGARSAYEMIVRAFAEGDRETLKSLLSPAVMAGFEKVIAEREERGDTEQVEFLHPPRADLEDVFVEGDTARAKVRFLAEHRARTKSKEGEAVDDRRTAELWTFERRLSTQDPNWLLVRVEAAEG